MREREILISTKMDYIYPGWEAYYPNMARLATWLSSMPKSTSRKAKRCDREHIYHVYFLVYHYQRILAFEEFVKNTKVSHLQHPSY